MPFTLAAADTIQGIAGTTTAITYSIYGLENSSGSGEVYKRLAQGQIATSAGVLYTVPAATIAIVKTITLINATGSSVAGIILYNGGTAATNQITGSFTLPAGATAILSDAGLIVVDNLGNAYTSGTNIFDATIVAATTTLATSLAGTASIAARRDHTHQSPGGIASIAAASSGINSTETIIVSAVVPASFMVAGTTFLLTASGVCTSTGANASNFRCRIGTAGNNTDAVASVVTPTAAASGTTIPFYCQLLVTVRSNGSSGTALGSGTLLNNGVTGVSAAAVVVGQVTATVTVNTTVQNTIQLSYIAAASTTTCTFHNASIEVVKM